MGLDTSHDCWHGAYSAFRRWRNALAETAGYPLQDSAYGPDYLVDIRDQFAEKNYDGEWDQPPGDDPLLYLLIHSDCDGVIHPEHGRHIAKRLRELAPLMPDEGGGHIYSMRGVTERFAAGLEAAADANEDVVFS